MHFMDDPMNLECTLSYPLTLDKNILAIRARETQEVVPKNGVYENIVDVTASSHMTEVTDSVIGMEAAPLDLQHTTEYNGMSNHGDCAQTKAAQEEGFALAGNKEEKVIDEQQKGSGGSSSLVSPGGNEVGGQAQQKKRKKRTKNWTTEETDVLLLQVVSHMQENEGQMDKRGACSGMLSKGQWEAISQEVHGRTWEECRGRMDTLKKYCDANKKEDFQAMQPKPSPCFKEDWYNQIRDHCLRRPKKRRIEVAESVPSLSKIGSGFVSSTLTLGNKFGDRGLQHPDAGPSNVVVTTPGGIESTVASFESMRPGFANERK